MQTTMEGTNEETRIDMDEIQREDSTDSILEIVKESDEEEYSSLTNAIVVQPQPQNAQVSMSPKNSRHVQPKEEEETLEHETSDVPLAKQSSQSLLPRKQFSDKVLKSIRNQTTARMPSVERPVTVVIRERVKPGKAAEFKKWVYETHEVGKKFPGHTGMRVIEQKKDWFVVIFSFNNYKNMYTWMESSERKQCLEKMKNIVEDTQIHLLPGLASLFHSGPNTIPRWKIFMAVWFQIYGIILLGSYTWNPLLREHGVPLPVILAMSSMLSVSLMTFIIMPLMTKKLLKGWLFKPQVRNKKLVPRPCVPICC